MSVHRWRPGGSDYITVEDVERARTSARTSKKAEVARRLRRAEEELREHFVECRDCSPDAEYGLCVVGEELERAVRSAGDEAEAYGLD